MEVTSKGSNGSTPALAEAVTLRTVLPQASRSVILASSNSVHKAGESASFTK